MEAIRTYIKTPADRELRIVLPSHVAENSTVEVSVILCDSEKGKQDDKFARMAEAVHDPLYMADLQQTMEDFSSIEYEVMLS